MKKENKDIKGMEKNSKYWNNSGIDTPLAFCFGKTNN